MKIGYIRSFSEQEILNFKNKTGVEKLFCDLDPTSDVEFKEMLECLKSSEDTLIIKDINNACRTIDDLLAIIDKHSIDKVDITSLEAKELDVFITNEGYLSLIKARDFILNKQLTPKKKLGRKMIVYPQGFRQVVDDYTEGNIKLDEALNKLGLKKGTFYSMLKLYKY